MQLIDLFRLRISVLLVLILLPASVWGGILADNSLEQSRQRFLAAEAALEQGEIGKYLKLKNRLKEYPLYSYLEFAEIELTLQQQKPVAVRAFIDHNGDTPLGRRLLDSWLNHLAKNQRWEEYLQFSTRGGSTTRRCQRLQALLKTGRTREALKQVEPLWLSGRSQPKACDPVFDAWMDAGRLTTDLVWQRIRLAMGQNRTRLTKYLKRFLPKEQQTWVDQWISLHHHPEILRRLPIESHPLSHEVIVHGIRRLARKDISQSISLWSLFYHDSGFTDRQHLKVSRTLAAYLVKNPDPALSQHLNTLIPSHLRQDPKISDKQFQAALQQKDWNQVLLTIYKLAEKEKNRERWRYWRARALIQLGNGREGEKLLTNLAKERSYYGFLAADRLGSNLNFHHQPLTATLSPDRLLADKPGLARARELKALGRERQARREWNLAMLGASEDELKSAALLARQWDWPSQSITALAKIRYWNDLELRFPLDYREQIDRQADAHGIDNAWIYAIMRQESAFTPDARSRAGALGLMQLMPQTARQVASTTYQRKIKTDDLLSPQVNIALGSSYLNQVYRQLQENPVLATAAYNAGPHRVIKWLPDNRQETDIWIETVPFHETREYLKRVLAYTLIYTHRLGDTPTQLPEKWLEPIGIADGET
jgi:soluble lytic murein transglycosylase